MLEDTTHWIVCHDFTTHLAILCAVSFVLLCVSALVSGAETSFFSLTHNDVHRLKQMQTKAADAVLRLLG
ncbi:MAG: DUF21 domain-containing protein, partial [Alistipes sp.]|nr:DUF21 domain-containing protein [Alistipes sp.]